MKSAIKKWGNSAAIRLPSSLINATNLEIDSEIYITEEAGKIIIQPAAQEYKLEELLAQITEDNRHSEVSTGKHTGKELW